MPVDRTTANGPSIELDIADRLLEIYSDVERKLAADIARRLNAGMDTPTWAADKLAQAGQLRRSASALVGRLAVDDGRITQSLVLAYMRGGSEANRELVRLAQPLADATRRRLLNPANSGEQELALQRVIDGRQEDAARRLAAATRAFPGLDALQRLVFSLASRLAGTHLPVVRWALDAYREAVGEGALAPVLLGTAARRAGTQRAWERLLSQGVKGFTDKAGRNWNLASYVEMATRTGVAQAAVEGHLDRLSDAGIDLVIVSNAPAECERCRPWEGKVLARSGPEGRRTVQVMSAIDDVLVEVEIWGTVDEAVAKGLLHPNCRHSLSAYLPGVTRAPTNTADPEGDQARQHLRALERGVRKAKLQQAGALTPEAGKAAEDDIRTGQAAIRDHIKANKHLELKRKREREQLDLGHTTGGQLGRPAKQPTPAPVPKPPAAAPAKPAGDDELATFREPATSESPAAKKLAAEQAARETAAAVKPTAKPAPAPAELAVAAAKNTPAPAAGPPIGDLLPRDADTLKAKEPEIKQAVTVRLNGEYAGLRVDVYTIKVGIDQIELRGTIHDAAGDRVGSTKREFYRTVENGVEKVWAQHAYLDLDENVQGQGFASAWNEHLYQWYRESGVSHVGVMANIDVGGYTWARAGFDFADQLGAHRIAKRLADVLASGTYDQAQIDAAEDVMRRVREEPFGSDNFPSAYEMSQVGRLPQHTGRDALWPGKSAMLGSGWNGIKPIAP